MNVHDPLRELAENTIRMNNPDAWRAMSEILTELGHRGKAKADIAREAWQIRKQIRREARADLRTPPAAAAGES
jgi:hypothetical protein